jgi:hypothetical protein
MDFPLLIDAKAIIVKYLASFDLKPIGTSTQEILQSYFNFKHKFIRSQPRNALMSKGLPEKARTLDMETVLKILEQKCISGEDINPFLSKGTFRLGVHDHLLNDWKIHHLHLNLNKANPADYFNDRSDNLLFVHITNESIYFVDIRPHQEDDVFAQRDLLRIVRDNWPQLAQQFRVQNEEMEIFPKFDEKDIAIMRKKGYMFWTQVDNHVYAPGLGSAVSGFSMEAGLAMDEFLRQLYKIHSYITEHDDELKSTLSAKIGRNLSNLHFALAFKDWLFYVYEVNSNQFVNFELSGYQPRFPDSQPQPLI